MIDPTHELTHVLAGAAGTRPSQHGRYENSNMDESYDAAATAFGYVVVYATSPRGAPVGPLLAPGGAGVI